VILSGVRPDFGRSSGRRTVSVTRLRESAELQVALQLLSVGATHRRQKEINVLQKRTFKVLAAIPKRDGGHWWMRLGNGHTNKDDSINVYLDAIPRDLKFTLRELDDEDLKRRDAYRANHGDAGPPAALDSPSDSPPHSIPL
jgi:hypothetical protein